MTANVILPLALSCLTQSGKWCQPDPPENCHLTAMGNFVEKMTIFVNFFEKNVKFLAIFWQSNGNFQESQVDTIFLIVLNMTKRVGGWRLLSFLILFTLFIYFLNIVYLTVKSVRKYMYSSACCVGPLCRRRRHSHLADCLVSEQWRFFPTYHFKWIVYRQSPVYWNSKFLVAGSSCYG